MKPFFSRAVSHVTPIITYGQRHLSARLTGSEAGAQSWLCWAEAWAVQCQGQTLPCSSILSYSQAGPVPARGHRHGQCIPISICLRVLYCEPASFPAGGESLGKKRWLLWCKEVKVSQEVESCFCALPSFSCSGAT